MSYPQVWSAFTAPCKQLPQQTSCQSNAAASAERAAAGGAARHVHAAHRAPTPGNQRVCQPCFWPFQKVTALTEYASGDWLFARIKLAISLSPNEHMLVVHAEQSLTQGLWVRTCSV